VLRLHEIIDDDENDCMYLITEYLPLGNLGERIKKGP
jgi:hypothetical protein